MKKRVTQKEIAEFVGLSYLTVNRVLSANDANSTRVSPETRDRILDAANKLGYRRNANASNLVLNRTSTIGVIWPYSAISYYKDVISSFERYCRSYNFHVMITHRPDYGIDSSQEIDFLLESSVDAMMVAPEPSGENLEYLQKITDLSIPLLLFNSFIPGIKCHYLGTDSRSGAIQVCQYLQSLNHKRIAFISGPDDEYTNNCRKEGYRIATATKNQPEIIISAGSYDNPDISNVIHELKAQNVTALFAANDIIAIRISQELRKLGYKLPEDMSITGYAGLWESELITPALTTVQQPVQQLGERAAEILLSLIENDQGPIFEELQDELIIRESCISIS